jgi:hypothetical protein
MHSSMTQPRGQAAGELDDPEPPYGHPIGTLTLVGVMGVLYAVGWAAFYFLLYLGRGPLLP